MPNQITRPGDMPGPISRALAFFPPDEAELFPMNSAKDGLPVGCLAKTPVKGWQTARHTVAELAARMERDDINIGCRVGKGRLVVDIDPKNGGHLSFPTFCERFGIDPASYATVRTGQDEKSGRRGAHLYMRVSEPNFECVFNLPDLPGIDFKYSGFVVAPGSVHASGLHYEPVGCKTLGETAAAPQALLDAIRRPPRKKLAADAASGFGEYTPEQIWPSLDRLPVEAFATNETWLQLAMAVHHMTAGEAEDIFLDWSARDPKYAGLRERNRDRWRSFGER